MPMTSRFDKLNNLSMDYSKYFGEMALTDEQKKQRIAFSKQMEDVMLFLFELLDVMADFGSKDEEYVKKEIATRYLGVLMAYTAIDGFFKMYADYFAEETLRTTLENIDAEWITSNDRARLIAENEANTSLNRVDYINAVASGKTRKQWITMKDYRVRKTHQVIDNKVLPINGVFIVGDSMMYFPKDTSLGAGMEEIADCRCSVKYL